jgi:hypothetical protein
MAFRVLQDVLLSRPSTVRAGERFQRQYSEHPLRPLLVRVGVCPWHLDASVPMEMRFSLPDEMAGGEFIPTMRGLRRNGKL